MLHALATGIEQIYLRGEYHGDLRADNVIVTCYGLNFDLKPLDMYHWGAANADNIRHDVFDLARIFYDALGGPKHYSKQPQPVKDICRGLKKGLIAREIRSAGKLRQYLENLEW